MPAFLDPAAMRIEYSLLTRRGHAIKPGCMCVEDGVLYVHWASQERFSAMLATLPVKR